MHFPVNYSSRRPVWRLLFLLLLAGGTLIPRRVFAHQAPYTNILMDVNTKMVAMELQIPISELQLAFNPDIAKDPATIVEHYGDSLKAYIAAHVHAWKNKQNPWHLDVVGMTMDRGTQQLSGPPFWEVRVQLTLYPHPGEDTRNFVLDYDVVMHQVMNHTALLSIRNDWASGVFSNNPIEVGVIRRDIATNTMQPFAIDLKAGSSWKGFTSMFRLGMQHIKEGTDHLLFIITLLLPACLLATRRRWTSYGGLIYSVTRLLKIITAFTIGHSITLLICVLGWTHIPTPLIEVTIAVSILVSAIHAIRPLFYGKEIFIALGFGLIHGLAFSQTLQELHLVSTDLALSVLGFNLGIETMQLAVIAVTIPWFVIMSQTRFFRVVKNTLAGVVSTAAIGWIVQRVTGDANIISNITDKMLLFSPWLILGLALLSLGLYGFTRTRFTRARFTRAHFTRPRFTRTRLKNSRIRRHYRGLDSQRVGE